MLLGLAVNEITQPSRGFSSRYSFQETKIARAVVMAPGRLRTRSPMRLERARSRTRYWSHCSMTRVYTQWFESNV